MWLIVFQLKSVCGRASHFAFRAQRSPRNLQIKFSFALLESSRLLHKQRRGFQQVGEHRGVGQMRIVPFGIYSLVENRVNCRIDENI